MILCLAYLVDIFTHLNKLNILMQGSSTNIITAREKLSAFTEKLTIWISRVQNGNFANFPLLDDIVLENEKIKISSEVVKYLKRLSKSFHEDFSTGDIEKVQRWILDPFIFNLDSMGDENLLKDELIELRANSQSEMKFQKLTLEQF